MSPGRAGTFEGPTIIVTHSLSANRRLKAAVASAALMGVSLVLASGPAQAAPGDIPLGTTSQFGVLAGAGITNTGPTTLTGGLELGSSPTTGITGSASITTTGRIRDTPDPVVNRAKDDLVAAYNVAAGRPATEIDAELGGKTLVAGVYEQSDALGLTGDLVLDGQGNNDSVFIFQVGSALTTASASRVVLINGAQPCHVYWQIGSSATFGTGSSFVGNVFALTSITATTTATFEGRLLARNGAVTLDTNTIRRPACAAVPTTPPPSTATPSTPAPTARPPARVRPTPTPTRSAGDDDEDSDGGSGGSGGDDTDSDGGGAADSDGFGGGDGGTPTDSDGSYTTTGIPNTGGPSALLAPIGAVAVLAGAGLVLASRRRSDAGA